MTQPVFFLSFFLYPETFCPQKLSPTFGRRFIQISMNHLFLNIFFDQPAAGGFFLPFWTPKMLILQGKRSKKGKKMGKMAQPQPPPPPRFRDLGIGRRRRKKWGVFWLSSGGNAQKHVHFRVPPQAPRKRGKIRYTKGESPPQAENFGDVGPLKC